MRSHGSSPTTGRLSSVSQVAQKSGQIDVAIRRFASQQPSVIRRFLLDLGCQLLLAGEVAIIFWCLKLPLHLGTLLGLEAASRMIKIAAGWMPARIGADEAGAILFFVSGLFDEVDGMLARMKFLESSFGTWFEGFVDNATYLLLFSGITAGLYRQRGPRELIYGIALIAGCILSVSIIAVLRKMTTAPGRPHEFAQEVYRLLEADSSNLLSQVVRQIHIFIKKGVAIHYVLLLPSWAHCPFSYVWPPWRPISPGSWRSISTARFSKGATSGRQSKTFKQQLRSY
jgi:phosphatidylglycerophosphate synthase